VVERDPGHDQGDAEQVLEGGDLPEHDQPDAGRGGWQDRQHQREGGPGQPGHGQLVGDIGGHRGAQAHADPPRQPVEVQEGREGAADAERVAATAATSMAAPSWSIRSSPGRHGRGRPRRTAFEGRNALLDEVNRRLLAALQADPRVTMSALARQVGMSVPAVTERVQRLERAGVIRGYRVAARRGGGGPRGGR
jgi:Winged helix-turn-helix DNA-binding